MLQLRPFLTVLLFFLIFSKSVAQDEKTDFIGVLLSGEFHENKLNPNLGFFWENRLSPKSGFELGVFYRTDRESMFVSISDPRIGTIAETITFRKDFITVPVLYRFSTRFAAFSLGPNVDIFSGWDQINKNLISLDRYTKSPVVELGALLKVGREIPIKGTLILEPEIRAGVRSIFYYSSYMGFGIKLKQQASFRK